MGEIPVAPSSELRAKPEPKLNSRSGLCGPPATLDRLLLFQLQSAIMDLFN